MTFQPPEPVTDSIALHVFERRGSGSFALRRGWPERRNVVPLVATLFNAPKAQPLKRLELHGGDPTHGYTPILELLRRTPSTLREMQLGDETLVVGVLGAQGDRIHDVDLGGIGPALEGLYKLRLLHVGHIAFTGAKLTNLRELEIHQERQTPDTRFLKGLGETDLPSNASALKQQLFPPRPRHV